MSEFLQARDYINDKLVKTNYTLPWLVDKTIQGEIAATYCLFCFDNFGVPILVATHKSGPGTYGQKRVAISMPDEAGVWLIEHDGNNVLVSVNKNQAPISSQRDTVHYLGGDTYYLPDTIILRLFLEQLHNNAVILETDIPIYPHGASA